MKKKYKIASGFTLVEILLVLLLSSLFAVVAINAAKRDAENNRANAAADQFKEVGHALEGYVTANYATLITVPLTNITVAQLIAGGFLPATFQDRTVFNSTYNMAVNRTIISANQTYLNGLVASSIPWLDESNKVRYDLLGQAIRRLGSQGGVSFYNATAATGLDGAWSLPSASYPIINAPGQLFYRSYFGINYDNIYLRLDGALPMRGNLDMGAHDINNVQNINATGLVSASNILASTATIGTVNSTTMNNSGTITTLQITGAGAGNKASFDDIVAKVGINSSAGDPLITNFGSTPAITSPDGNNGYINARDVFVKNDRGSGSWLSDRLPKYSSRGVYRMLSGDTVTKPLCNSYGVGAGGIPKIEIIPQSQYNQGRVLGPIGLSSSTVAGVTTYTLYQDQWTVGSTVNYAVDNGASWTAYSLTPDYQGGYSGLGQSQVLAHVYCDFGS